MISPEEINRRRRELEKQAASYYGRLKRRPPAGLDDRLQELDEEVFAGTDCLACANCCKTLKTVFKERDIIRIAASMRMRPADFVSAYLVTDEDGDYVQKSLPCPFLAPDNKCNIYEVRPHACQSYPHTGTLPLKKSWNLIIKNAAVCPAVHEITLRLKKDFPE